MKQRYRLIRRGERGAKFYCFDILTQKRTSLGTATADEAAEIVRAKNQSSRQPALNLQIARAYLAGSDPEVARRTWQNVLDEIPRLKRASTRTRWETAIKDRALDSLRNLTVLETRAEHFLTVLQSGSVSTNTFLRRIHRFALDMNWLPWPVLPQKRWPALKFKEKRAITFEEHQAILGGEQNSECYAYYQLLWHLGGSQTDVARLRAEDIDWTTAVPFKTPVNIDDLWCRVMGLWVVIGPVPVKWAFSRRA